MKLSKEELEELEEKIDKEDYDEDVMLSSIERKSNVLENGIIGNLSTINAIVELSSGKRVCFSGSAEDIKLDYVSID